MELTIDGMKYPVIKFEEENEELEEKKEEHISVIKYIKINLKTTYETLETCQDELMCVDKLRQSVKLVTETDHEMECVKSKNTFLSIEAEHHMKYRNNYYQRNNFYRLTMEDLAQLEDLSTKFSFFLRRSTKRRCLNRMIWVAWRNNTGNQTTVALMEIAEPPRHPAIDNDSSRWSLISFFLSLFYSLML